MKRIFGALTVALVAGGAAQAQTFAETKLTASDGAAVDKFGASVALSDGTALIGAYGDDDKGTQSGSAYLFDADGTQTHKLTASDGSAFDQFGCSVALSDGTALVGAYRDDDKGTDSGSAYLFDADGTLAHKLTASDGAAYDTFGLSVALSDGTALIGAYGDDDKGTDSGSAYLFDADGTQTHKLTASDGEAGDQFGYSVALSDGTALVGAFGDNDKGYASGSAYLFDPDGTQMHKLTASDGAMFDYFGYSVSISGNLALVGAFGRDANIGAAYLYHAKTGVELAKLTASDGAAGDSFGFSVALDGSTALIGAEDAGGKGAAYLYDLSPTWTSVFGGAYDDADNWNVLTPDIGGLDVKINPDRGNQVVTGPAGASEVGTLYLGHGAGRLTLALQQGGGIIAEDGVEIGAKGTLKGTGGGVIGDIRNDGTLVIDDIGLSGDIANAGLVQGSGFVGGDLTNAAGGEVRLGGDDSLTVAGDFRNEGTVNAAFDTTFDFEGMAENEGQINIVGGQTAIFGDVANRATGRILSGGGGGTIFFDDVMNAGVLDIGIGSTMTIVGDYSGPGSAEGGGTLVFEGLVSTGSSPSLVSFATDIMLDGSTAVMELGGTARGSEYDAWDVDGALALGGTLKLVNFGTFFGKVGDIFALFGATGGITGDFASVEFAPLASGTWREVRTATTYGFMVEGPTVAPVPLPASVWLMFSGLGLLALQRRAQMRRVVSC